MINVQEVELTGSRAQVEWAHDVLEECVKAINDDEAAQDFVDAVSMYGCAKWVIDNKDDLLCGECSDPIFFLKAYLSEMNKVDIMLARGEEDSYLVDNIDLTNAKCVDISKRLYIEFWKQIAEREGKVFVEPSDDNKEE